MPRFAQVVAKSNLIQLDREFDFVIPERLDDLIQIGQQVSFPFGRSKKLQHGFVVGISQLSEYATSELAEIVHPTPVLPRELFDFCRKVADRQCVAIGEILSAAIPDHMARTQLPEQRFVTAPNLTREIVELSPPLTKKSAVLTSARAIEVDGELIADWAITIAQTAGKILSESKSVLVVVPEQADIDEFLRAAAVFGLAELVTALSPNQKRSDRFKLFHQILGQELSLVVGTRSAIYAPAQNLGLVAVYDDLDDSLREQGSPFTHARELALMRAGFETNLMIVAPYRSVEVQRLVEIGYITDHETILPAPRIAFTEPGARIDESSYKLIKERLEVGPVLVLLPRKGSSAALYCAGCGERLRCSCGGMIWEPTERVASCRICNKPHVRCTKCQHAGLKRGRTGSTRTVSELGKAFPQVAIAEATADKQPSGLKPRRQIVVATPSAAPKVPGGYSGVLILDADIWLSRQSLNAEAIAFRDWMGAVELLSPDGRVVLSGVDRDLGQAFAMQQHREIARAQLKELRSLGLPPATRIVTVETEPENLDAVLEIGKEANAKPLRVDTESGTVLFSFSYQDGPDLARNLRALALKTSARVQGGLKRRGVRVVMDDPNAL